MIKIHLQMKNRPAEESQMLTRALSARGISLSSDRSDNAVLVVIASLSVQGIAAAAEQLKESEQAIVAAQTPPNFPFPDALLARASERWQRPALSIPPLHQPDNFAQAAQIIAEFLKKSDSAHALPCSESDVKSDSQSASDATEDLDQESRDSAQKAVAKARQALDEVLSS